MPVIYLSSNIDVLYIILKLRTLQTQHFFEFLKYLEQLPRYSKNRKYRKFLKLRFKKKAVLKSYKSNTH